MRSAIAISSMLLAALSGCACDTVPSAAVTDCDAQVVPGGAEIDVLLVVDDSGSMIGEQEELSANLSQFVDALLSSPVRLDLHLAVTNTSVTGYAGETKYPSSSPAPDGTPYPAGALVAVHQNPDGTVTAGNFVWDTVLYPATGGWGGPRILSTGAMSDADVERDFEANVLVGADGSAKEQPLRAMRRALEQANPGGVNDGFLRPGAKLAVVLITDEDDCSESVAPYEGVSQSSCHYQFNKDNSFDPLDDFVELLGTAIRGEDRDPTLAVIAGFDPATLAPTGCDTGGSSSLDDPTRLDDFLVLLEAARPGHTFKDSICSSFGPSLLALADRLVPQTLPLAQAPADWRMLAVSIERAGDRIPCPLALAGSAEAAAPGTAAVFTPAPPGGTASLTFRQACTLGLGDRVDLRIVCAR